MKHLVMIAVVFLAQSAMAQLKNLDVKQAQRTSEAIQGQIATLAKQAQSDRTIECNSSAQSQISYFLTVAGYLLQVDDASTTPLFVAQSGNTIVRINTTPDHTQVTKATLSEIRQQITGGPLESVQYQPVEYVIAVCGK